MKKSLVSIILATFNSASTLEKVLVSIGKQSYPLSCLELIVVDGGSTDNTRNIAQSYGCRIIDNPKTLPGWAKYFGYTLARGEYAMFLDSDEVIEDSQSIERKIVVMKENPSVHAVTGSGYRNPKNYSFLNQYINEFGDPFSFFYYRQSKDCRYFISQMKRLYPCVKETDDYLILNFLKEENLPLLEFGAMGGIVDLVYLKSHAPEIIHNPALIPHLINVLVMHGSRVALIKNDVLIHYSSDTWEKYLGKIKSRVINNIYTPAKEGFTGRNEFASQILRYKKYLFLPYALTVVGPLIDSLYLSITRRHFGYFIHILFSFYTACLIIYYKCLKLVGIHAVMKSYGESVPLVQK